MTASCRDVTPGVDREPADQDEANAAADEPVEQLA
jgi:hypothetical protein